MKKILKTTLIGAAIAVGATSLTGCFSMKSIGEYHAKDDHERLYMPLQQAEPHIAKHFLMTNPENGLLTPKKFALGMMNRHDYYPDSILGSEAKVHHSITGADNTGVFISSSIFSHLERSRGEFTVNAYDVENDAIAERYISMAKERGNIVKSYSDSMAAKFNAVVSMKKNPRLKKGRSLGFARLLVEFDGKGNVQSYLIRRFERHVLLGEVTYFMYSVVQTGDMQMRMIENRVSKERFETEAINEF